MNKTNRRVKVKGSKSANASTITPIPAINLFGLSPKEALKNTIEERNTPQFKATPTPYGGVKVPYTNRDMYGNYIPNTLTVVNKGPNKGKVMGVDADNNPTYRTTGIDGYPTKIKTKITPKGKKIDLIGGYDNPKTQEANALSNLGELMFGLKRDTSNNTESHVRTSNPLNYINTLIQNFPASMLMKDVVQNKLYKALGVNTRSIIPELSYITETDINPTTYNALSNMLREDMGRRKISKENRKVGSHYRIDPNTLYGGEYASKNTSIAKGFGIGRDNIQYTMGNFGYTLEDNGIRVTDIYDYNEGQGNYNNAETIYAKMRRWAGRNASKDTDPDEQKLKYNIFIPYTSLEKEQDEGVFSNFIKSFNPLNWIGLNNK